MLLGDHLKRFAENKPAKSFNYINKGSGAIISKYHAIIDLAKDLLKGFLPGLAGY